jgi:hypothetical protein
MAPFLACSHSRVANGPTSMRFGACPTCAPSVNSSTTRKYFVNFALRSEPGARLGHGGLRPPAASASAACAWGGAQAEPLQVPRVVSSRTLLDRYSITPTPILGTFFPQFSSASRFTIRTPIAVLGLCRLLDPNVLSKPRKELECLPHGSGISLGEQGLGLIYNFRHLLLGDDFLVDELASQGNEEGCICIRALGGTEHEHEGPPIT